AEAGGGMEAGELVLRQGMQRLPHGRSTDPERGGELDGGKALPWRALAAHEGPPDGLVGVVDRGRDRVAALPTHEEIEDLGRDLGTDRVHRRRCPNDGRRHPGPPRFRRGLARVRSAARWRAKQPARPGSRPRSYPPPPPPPRHAPPPPPTRPHR